MITTVILIVLALVAALLVYASTRPDTFTVQRNTLIQAPPEKVFALIDDYRAWAAWSPWEHKDPAMRRTFEELKLVVEPSGAAALAALECGLVDVAGKTVLAFATGGNVSFESFAAAIGRAA